jgi:hypothetical protein
METATPWFLLTIALLATWRLSHLLANEDGPGAIIFRLRAHLGTSFFGALIDCFGCVSIWVAVPFAFFVTRQPLELVVVWLALSGGAMLLERLNPEPLTIEPTTEPTEGDQSDGVLR